MRLLTQRVPEGLDREQENTATLFMTTLQHTQWQLPLAAWSEWTSDATDGVLPVLDFVEPMLRRRLSALAKISLWVAHNCAHNLKDVRMIYASQHGEIVRTTKMLEELADNEPLSPTAFSMSVLNASIGLYSIMQGNTAPATAIAAGEETLGYALLEAHLQLSNDPSRPVLVIYADEAVPTIWDADIEEQPHAIAILLSNNADMKLICSYTHDTGPAGNTPQARAFTESLKSEQAASWISSQHKKWHWQCTAA